MVLFLTLDINYQSVRCATTAVQLSQFLAKSIWTFRCEKDRCPTGPDRGRWLQGNLGRHQCLGRVHPWSRLMARIRDSTTLLLNITTCPSRPSLWDCKTIRTSPSIDAATFQYAITISKNHSICLKSIWRQPTWVTWVTSVFHDSVTTDLYAGGL